MKSSHTILIYLLLLLCVPVVCNAQQAYDEARAKKLYTSTDFADHPTRDHEADAKSILKSDSILQKAAEENRVSFRKIFTKSRVDDLKIPLYIFEPTKLKRKEKHPALVWVYGGIHDHFGINYFPFIKEAIDKGYVVIAPEYRGARGYGKAFYDAIDYGGYEVDDIITTGEFIQERMAYVDADRIGVIGWSHGGYIALLAATRDETIFNSAVASVPVTNLIFRLSYKGPEYQRTFTTQKRIQGLPFEKRELYLERSPLYQVDKLQIPVMVQVATNDTDVDFVEAEMLINALKVKKPDLAETVIYQDPPHEHFFNRQVDLISLERKDTPEQIDSWNKIWGFLDQQLSPIAAKP
ncbi:MAG: alpha/beta fold hydrolase [Bacteroidota bacterium]